MSKIGRQLNNRFRNFGRQLSSGATQFGRQLHSGLKLLPSAYKDTSKVYSDLEKRTKGIPLVPSIFGSASKATGAIGDALSGDFGKAFSGGQQAVSGGKGAFQQAMDLAPYAAMFM